MVRRVAAKRPLEELCGIVRGISLTVRGEYQHHGLRQQDIARSGKVHAGSPGVPCAS